MLKIRYMLVQMLMLKRRVGLHHIPVKVSVEVCCCCPVSVLSAQIYALCMKRLQDEQTVASLDICITLTWQHARGTMKMALGATCCSELFNEPYRMQPNLHIFAGQQSDTDSEGYVGILDAQHKTWA